MSGTTASGSMMFSNQVLHAIVEEVLNRVLIFDGPFRYPISRAGEEVLVHINASKGGKMRYIVPKMLLC